MLKNSDFKRIEYSLYDGVILIFNLRWQVSLQTLDK